MAHILGILPFADMIICKVAPWDPAKCREKAVDAISVLKARGLASLLKEPGRKAVFLRIEKSQPVIPIREKNVRRVCGHGSAYPMKIHTAITTRGSHGTRIALIRAQGRLNVDPNKTLIDGGGNLSSII